MLDWTAERAAELILPKGRAVRIEITAGIQIGIAQEFEGIAVEGIAPGLGDDVDHAAVVIAVLGIEVVGEDAELINRIEVRHDRRASIHVLLHVNPIHQETIGGFSLSVDRQISWIQIAGGGKTSRYSRHDYGIWQQG